MVIQYTNPLMQTFINLDYLIDVMEATGFKKRLEEAKRNSENIKLLFQYPATEKVIVKKGKVLSVNEDSFDFLDRFDGIMTFSYKFIAEIGVWDGK